MAADRSGSSGREAVAVTLLGFAIYGGADFSGLKRHVCRRSPGHQVKELWRILGGRCSVPKVKDLLPVSRRTAWIGKWNAPAAWEVVGNPGLWATSRIYKAKNPSILAPGCVLTQVLLKQGKP